MSVPRSAVIRLAPKGTTGIRVEIHYSYSCASPPKVEAVDIIGFNQAGFVFSSQYEVRAFVDGGTRGPCTLADCSNAYQYDFTIRLSNLLVLGLGFGYGGGTGTFGWRTSSVSESVRCRSDCICCDEPLVPTAQQASAAQSTQSSPATVLAAILIVFAMGALPLVIPQGTVVSALAGMASAAIIVLTISALGRAFLRYRRRRYTRDEAYIERDDA